MLKPKFLARTNGDFQLLDLSTNEILYSDRPTVITGSVFMQTRTATGQVNIMAELKPEATDAEFQEFWAECEGDSKLAIESFLSTYGIDASDEPEQPKMPAYVPTEVAEEEDKKEADEKPARRSRKGRSAD